MWTKIKKIQTLLSIPDLKLPSQRIVITVDLDQPLFDLDLRKFIERIALFGTPLTIFTPNHPLSSKGYGEIRDLLDFAREKELVIEMGSHSVTHESLKGKKASEIVSIIEKSIGLFREGGIPVHGFRAPFLSIEGTYRHILPKIGKDILKYDSSVLYEGNLFHSRLHDLIPRKCPHRVGSVWEFPLSCLDDYLLFGKLKKADSFVSAYWKRKMDINLRNHHYFLLLIHPPVILNHFRELEDLLTYGIQNYSETCFTTCHELVKELSQRKEEKEVPGIEDL
jgi:peptidoglycan/xylan/chitin deacetylase (PgdA/CDA1 family)